MTYLVPSPKKSVGMGWNRIGAHSHQSETTSFPIDSDPSTEKKYQVRGVLRQ